MGFVSFFICVSMLFGCTIFIILFGKLKKVLIQIMRNSNLEKFEQVWERVANPIDGESITMELRPLLQKTYVEFAKQPTDLREIKASLENLLSFLTTNSGRTSANCLATDLFFCLSSDWNEEIDWEIFPDTLTGIIGDLGGALHDTVAHPEIARSFDSLPEQLLDRVKRWKPE